MEGWVLAFDVGTSGVKAAAVDTGGVLRAVDAQPLKTYAPRPGWGEHDPEELWAAVCAGSRRVADAMGGARPEGIAFGTYWKGVLPLDADGRPLSRMILWLDGRAEAQAERMSRDLAPAAFHKSDYWPRLLWLRESDPERFACTAAILEAGGWLKYRATGRMTADYNNDLIHAPDPANQPGKDAILRYMGLPPGLFPPRVASDEQAGFVTAAAAEELGVPAGVPVFGGTTDLAAIAIGAGCAAPGKGHMYMGSSGWVGAVAPSDGKPTDLPFRPGTELIVPGMRSVGLAYNWARSVLYPGIAEPEIHALVSREASAVPPGCGGLSCIPWINGEKAVYDPRGTGVFFGLNAGHGRAEMMAAVMEGVAFQFRWCAERAVERGVPLDDLCAVGGCVRSAAWMQRMADVLGRMIRVPASPQHAGTVGTAFCALAGLGRCRDLAAAGEQLRVESIYRPRPENTEIYDRLYRQWRGLVRVLAEENERREQA